MENAREMQDVIYVSSRTMIEQGDHADEKEK